MGIPRKGKQCLAVIYSNIVVLNARRLTSYVRRHPSKKIKRLTPKSYLKNFSNASKSHKTSRITWMTIIIMEAMTFRHILSGLILILQYAINVMRENQTAALIYHTTLANDAKK